MMPDRETTNVDPTEPGSWQPLDQAVHALGMSERAIDRLVSEGRLHSREDGHARIDIWVADAERVDLSPSQSVEIIRRDQALLSVERLSSAMSHQVVALTAPLAESYERNVQLARENGALHERVVTLERELQGLRESAAAAQQIVEQTRKRLEAVEGANAGLTRMLAAAQRDEPEERRRPWLLLAAVVLIVVLVAVAAVAFAALRWLTP